MKLTGAQIRGLIVKKEDERVEFKRASSELPENIWETYSAFCNTDGGTIILGIREEKNKRYSIEGVANAHKLIDDFWASANNSEKVSYSIFFGHYVYPVKCGRKTVVVIEVPRAPREARPVYVGEDVFKGSFRIYDFFFKIHDRVTGDVKIPFKIAADGITRIDDTPVHKALREVLANALIHADYHGRRGIVVEKHFRTITFSNPGTMRVSKSVAVAGGTSDARNSAIFNIFALVDIGERSGMGLANLHGLWKKYGYAEPKITESYDPDRTVLVVTTDDDTVNDTVTRPENGAEPDQNPTKNRPGSDQKCPNSAPEVPQKCPNTCEGSERGDNKQERGDNKSVGGDNKSVQGDNKSVQGDNNQHENSFEQRRPFSELFASAKQVFRLLSEDGSLTQQGLCTKLGLSRKTIAKAIAVLIRERYIIRNGARKNGCWEVMS